MTETNESYEFSVGEKVLVYFDGLLYEGVCLKLLKNDKGENQYFVHYKGFKKKYDEWTSKDEILKINQINLEHKARLLSIRKSCRKAKKNKNNSSRKPANVKRGKAKKNVDQSAGPASVKCVEPATVQFSGPASEQLREVNVKLIDILKFPGPYTAQSTKLTIQKSAESDIQKLSEPAIKPKLVKKSEELFKTKNACSPKPENVQQGDKVLVYYDGLLYEAVCLKLLKNDNGENQYLVHYKGFKKKYDEWINEDDILQINQINLEHKERLLSNRKSCRKAKKNKNNSSRKPANVKRGRSKKNVEMSAGPAAPPLEELYVDKSVELDIQSFSEPCVKTKRVKKSRAPWKTNNAFSPKPANLKRGGAKNNVAMSAGPASAPLEKITVEKSAESDIQTVSEPADKSKLVEISRESFKTNNAFSPKPANLKLGGAKNNVRMSAGPASVKCVEPATAQLSETASVQLKEVTVKLIDILKFPGLFTAHSTRLTVEKSTESDIQTLTELAVIPKLVKKCQEPFKKNNVLSPKPEIVKRGRKQKNVEQSAGQDSGIIAVLTKEQLLANIASEKSAESALLACEKLAPILFALEASEKSTELIEDESDFLLFAESDPAQLKEVTVVKPAESDIQKFSEPAVKLKRLKKSHEPWKTNYAFSPKPANLKRGGAKNNVAMSAGPASAQLEEITVEKSAESDIQTVSEPADKSKLVEISREPFKTNNAFSPKPAKLKQGGAKKNVEMSAGPASAPLEKITVEKSAESDIQTVSEPADKSKLVEISREPFKTNNAFSPKPANLKQDRAKNNVEMSAGPASVKCVEPATAQLSEPASVQLKEVTVKLIDILKFPGPFTAQSTRLTVEKSTESDIQTLTEPAVIPKLVKKCQEPFKKNNVLSPKPEIVKRGRKQKNVEQSAGQDSGIIAVLTKEQLLANIASEKSAESALLACEKLAPILFALEASEKSTELIEDESDFLLFAESDPAQLKEVTVVKPAESDIQKFSEPAVKLKRLKKSHEPWKTNYAFSPKLANVKRGMVKKNVGPSTGPTSAKCVEPATVQFAQPASVKLKELTVKLIDILKFPGSYTSQSTKLTVEKSAESDTQMFSEPCVKQKRVKKSRASWKTNNAFSPKPANLKLGGAKNNVAMSAGPASAPLEEITVEKSAELDIQTVSEPADKSKLIEISREPFKTNNAFSPKLANLKGGGAKNNVAMSAAPASAPLEEITVEKSAESDIQTVSEPADKSKLVEISREPFKTNNAFSPKPANLKRGRSKKNVEMSAGPAAPPLEEMYVDKSVELDIQSFSEPWVKTKRVKKSRAPWKTNNAFSPKPANLKRGGAKNNVAMSAGPASAPLEEITVEKSAESDIQTVLEPADKSKLVEISREPFKTNNAFSPKPANLKQGGAKKNVEMSAGPASAPLEEIAVEKSAESDIQTVLEPADKSKLVEISREPFKTNNAFSPKPANLKQGGAKKNVEMSAGPASAPLEKITVEKSAESDIQTVSEPADKSKLVEISREPFKTINAFSPKPEKLKRGGAKNNVAMSAGPASAPLEEIAVEKSAESDIQTVSEPADKSKLVEISREPFKTNNAFSPKPEKLKRGGAKNNVAMSAGPASAPLEEIAVEKSAESDIQTVLEPADKSKLVEISREPFKTNNAFSPKPANLKRGRSKKNVEMSAGPAAPPLEELYGDKSVELDIQSFSEPAFKLKRLKKSHEPWKTNYAFSPKPANLKRGGAKNNVAMSAGPASAPLEEITVEKSAESDIQTVSEPADKSKLVEISRAPWKTNNAFSPKPANLKQSRSKKHLDQSAESAVKLSTVLAVGQSAKQAVRRFTDPTFEQSAILIVENEPAVRLLATALRKLVLPHTLKEALNLDVFIMYQEDDIHQKILRFSEKNCLAEVIYAFTKSSYFVDDRQKKYSTIFCVSLMQYFNESLHKYLSYEVERMYCSQHEAMELFMKKRNNQPHFNYIYEKFPENKLMWCYVYGPMHLLRLIVHLPKIVTSASFLPEYDLDAFVHHIKKLIWFLEDNFNTYFTSSDYIEVNDIIYNT